MASDAWKTIERTVAAILGGVRSWETDFDVLIATSDGDLVDSNDLEDAGHLMWLQRKGYVKLAAVECKNLTAPTVAQLELFLALNQRKIDQHIPGATNALVIKRKAGPGRSTPYLLVMPLEVPPSAPTPQS